MNPKAANELKKLPHETVERIKKGLKNLRENPTKARSGADVKRIAGTFNPTLYRLRIGGYRAIFWVDKEKGEVLVEKIAPRRIAYIRI
ncbi:MAG: type II toxin-antitoxin system RelE/ParE family toxin [Candidatus Hodarchaeaceae archaeon]|nr:type II toxin-antitoxin system RelE/ParE family toxin [Candidatus Hodarchaeaceae archaeon]